MTGRTIKTFHNPAAIWQPAEHELKIWQNLMQKNPAFLAIFFN
jgi:hypothetical protein